MLNGSDPLGWLQDDPYVDPGATATDLVDGDLTGAILIDDSAVDVTTPGNYPVLLTVTDVALNETSVTRTVNVVPQPNSGDVLYRVNAGGPQVAAADASLPDWSEDTLANPSPYVNSAQTNVVYSSTAGSASPGPINITDPSIPGGAPLAIFQTERFDQPAATTPAEMQWSFPLPATGSYAVRLYFAEIFGGITAAGQRVFNVSAEGVVPAAFTSIDPYALGGGVDQARVLSHTLSVEDGALDLEFIHDIENPSVKAIEIIYVSATAGGLPPTANPDTAPVPIEIGGSTTFSVIANDTDDLNAIDPASVVITTVSRRRRRRAQRRRHGDLHAHRINGPHGHFRVHRGRYRGQCIGARAGEHRNCRPGHHRDPRRKPDTAGQAGLQRSRQRGPVSRVRDDSHRELRH